MDSTTNASSCPFQSLLPHELVGLVASHLCNKSDLASFALTSQACHSETISYLYTGISFASAAVQPKSTWVKTIVLWTRTMSASRVLASRVERLILHLPESELPVLFRRTLYALQACVNLQDLELYLASYEVPPSWILPYNADFKLTSFATDIPAVPHLGLFLESQPSIRILLLEAFDMRLCLKPGSLPLLMNYTGFTTLISGARPPGTLWENLVRAELRDAYRWEKGLLDLMPHLRALDISVSAGSVDLLARIAEKCGELRSLTLRDGNGLLYDRHEFGDCRLSGVTLLPEFTTSFSTFRYLSSLTIDPVYRSRNQAPASTEHKHLVAWHAHCPTLRYFTSPTGRQWIYMPTMLSGNSPTGLSPDLRQWTVAFEPTSSESTFVTDPDLFGMRRAGGARERLDGGSVEDLIAIIERLNHERRSQADIV